MYLDLLNSHNFPNWPTVFGIAEKVLQRIYEGDPEFYEHLKIISKIHVKVNPKVRQERHHQRSLGAQTEGFSL